MGKKYQTLRILVLLFAVFCLLEAVHTLITFSNCIDSILRIIITAKDALFGIVVASAIWQVGVLIHRYSPRTSRHRIVLITFVALNFVLNILDILYVVFDMK